MTDWVWLPAGLAVAALLVLIARAVFIAARVPAFAEYPNGVTLAGSALWGRARYVMVQWVRAPDNRGPCPLVVHLPGGDLGGDALCCWGAPQAAAELGGPADLDLFPFHDGNGGVGGVRVGVLPGCPPVEVSVGGTRLTLPLAERDAVALLGEPLRRVVGER